VKSEKKKRTRAPRIFEDLTGPVPFEKYQEASCRHSKKYTQVRILKISKDIRIKYTVCDTCANDIKIMNGES